MLDDLSLTTAVEFTQLIDDLDVCNGDDALRGGDSSLLITDLLRAPVVSGPAAFVAQAAYTPPFTGAADSAGHPRSGNT